jgi:hypothetical protein
MQETRQVDFQRSMESPKKDKGAWNGVQVWNVSQDAKRAARSTTSDLSFALIDAAAFQPFAVKEDMSTHKTKTC